LAARQMPHTAADVLRPRRGAWVPHSVRDVLILDYSP
jgi:hypothetical protein